MAPGLLERAIAAHGGAERYAAASEIHARIRSGGFALTARGKSRAFSDYRTIVSTGVPHTVIEDYPQAGTRGVFEPGRVRIESDAGELLKERENPRAAFATLRRKLWWDHLDALYFAGYALWNYFNTPWLLARPGVETREDGDWLHVSLPPDIPTHSREQSFCFDPDGMLRTLHYTAEVFGGWARAVHYCAGHEQFDGLVFPTRRKVHPRRKDGSARPRPTLIWLDIESVSVR